MSSGGKTGGKRLGDIFKFQKTLSFHSYGGRMSWGQKTRGKRPGGKGLVGKRLEDIFKVQKTLHFHSYVKRMSWGKKREAKDRGAKDRGTKD